MPKNTFRLLIAPILALFLAAAPVPARGFDLTLLHVNDTHSYLDATGDKLSPGGVETYVRMGGWARLETAVNAARSESANVLLLHAGDAVQGDLYFMKYGGRPEMELLDRLGFTAMTLGNHEFDKGADFLAGFLGCAKVPVVCANLDAAKVPALAERVRPSIVVEAGGERVGIVGLTTSETPVISSPGPVAFSDEVRAATAAVQALEAKGVNKIVLLTHVGFDRDLELAATVPGVDVVVGGHSHTLLGSPETIGSLGLKPRGDYPAVVQGADGDVLVVTAWKWARILGWLDVTFDGAGHVTGYRARLTVLLADTFQRKNSAGKKAEVEGADRAVLLARLHESAAAAVVRPDETTRAYLGPFSQGVEAMRSDVIGAAVQPLAHIRVPGTSDTGEPLPQGSQVAPLVCQAMLAKIAGTGERADLALQNAGGVRESVPQGEITVGTAYTLMPFGNTLVLVELTGAQVKQALETGVTRGSGAFPYVAGARYTADMNRPEGDRVTTIEIEKGGQWTAMDPAGTYRLVTNSYLASGGDGYEVMKSAKSSYDTGFVDAQAFIEYVEQAKRLTPPATTGVTYIPAQ